MATLNIRIDKEIKDKACVVLDELNLSQSEAVRLLFEYIAKNKKLPIQTEVVSEDELALLATVRERLANPQPPVYVSLDEL